MMLVGKGLADTTLLPAANSRSISATRSSRQKGEVLPRRVSALAGAGKRGGQALVLDLVCAQTAHAFDAGRRGDTVSHLRRDGGMEVASHGSGGGQVKVRRQLTV